MGSMVTRLSKNVGKLEAPDPENDQTSRCQPLVDGEGVTPYCSLGVGMAALVNYQCCLSGIFLFSKK